MARGGFLRGLLAIARRLALALLAALAILASAVAFFPAERLAPAVIARIEAASGARAALDEIALGLDWSGPYAQLEGLSLVWTDDSALTIDSLHVAPEWSLAWLRGAPAARLVSAAAFGQFEGRLSAAGIAGQLRGLDLAQLPRAWFGESGAPLEGPLDARIEAAQLAGQWSGAASLSGRGGVLALPGMPVAVPYETLDGRVALDALGNLALEQIALRGPLASCTASGRVSTGYAGPASGPIDVVVEVTHLDPALAPLLASYGLALEDGGTRRVHVGGTPDRIEVR